MDSEQMEGWTGRRMDAGTRSRHRANWGHVCKVRLRNTETWNELFTRLRRWKQGFNRFCWLVCVTVWLLNVSFRSSKVTQQHKLTQMECLNRREKVQIFTGLIEIILSLNLQTDNQLHRIKSLNPPLKRASCHSNTRPSVRDLGSKVRVRPDPLQRPAGSWPMTSWSCDWSRSRLKLRTPQDSCPTAVGGVRDEALNHLILQW